MAYTKLSDMLGVALELRASSLGLTIDQLMERTGRSRKTVERMLHGLAGLGIEVEPSRLDSDHHLTKRWRLRGDMPGLLLSLQPQERGALERHMQTLTDSTTSRALAKLLANQKPLSNHLAIDEEELINRTAHIGRTGPRTQANEAHMAIFERSIQGSNGLKSATELRTGRAQAGVPSTRWGCSSAASDTWSPHVKVILRLIGWI